ncbi:MAG TPA: desulfoferrodoxin [Armatimonadota bacterium]|nr:desulfoferrodoxin [Armatimonadota bacterium]
MTERLHVYKCLACGTIVEVLQGGPGTLACCDQPMKLFTENTVDAAKEKHVPVLERVDGGILVQVGSVAHPMEAAHYIAFIELIADGIVYRQFLNPGDAPQAFFPVTAATVAAREYCNLHGLWKGA